MDIQHNADGSLYISANIDGCEYGQFYNHMTEEQAIARFKKMVALFQAGQDLVVLSGNF